VASSYSLLFASEQEGATRAVEAQGTESLLSRRKNRSSAGFCADYRISTAFCSVTRRNQAVSIAMYSTIPVPTMMNKLQNTSCGFHIRSISLQQTTVTAGAIFWQTLQQHGFRLPERTVILRYAGHNQNRTIVPSHVTFMSRSKIRTVGRKHLDVSFVPLWHTHDLSVCHFLFSMS